MKSVFFLIHSLVICIMQLNASVVLFNEKISSTNSNSFDWESFIKLSCDKKSVIADEQPRSSAINAECFQRNSCQNPALSSDDIKNIVRRISMHEKFFLNKYFEYLIRYGHLGQVLFLDKPMCYITFPIDDCSCYPSRLISQGWHIWKNYEYLLDHQKYIFHSVISEDKFNSGKAMCDVYVINKENLLRLLRENETFFKNQLGDSFCSDLFLASLESSRILNSLIRDNDAVLGVMLGYGIASSLNYKNRVADDFHKTKTKKTKSSETVFINIAPVQFIPAPDSVEANSLQNKYEHEVLELNKIYSRRNFFMKSMEKLCALSN